MKRSTAQGIAASFILGLAMAGSVVAQGTGFTDIERDRILAHGPWPPVREADSSNAVDGVPEAVALGRTLFFDTRLSASGDRSCATCHDPAHAFQNGRQFAARHGRDTPGLLDVGLQRWFGWDGAADSLWAASLGPLTATDELGATPRSAAQLLSDDERLGALYATLFGPPRENDDLLVNLAKALAAWQATLVSPRSAFDDFRDALARDDHAAIARYPSAARRGLQLFVGKARCFLCHAGANFSNGEFADVGRPYFTADGVDPGRWAGLTKLLASPWNRLGRAAEADSGPDSPQALSTRHVILEPRLFGEFRVPGLRSLMATAPYFHDGSASDLIAVIEHYSELDESRLHADGVRVLRALRLSDQEKQDLRAFLESLGSPSGTGVDEGGVRDASGGGKSSGQR